MSLPLLLIVATLAAHRLTRLIVEDEILSPVRGWVLRRWAEDEQVGKVPRWSDALVCYWCMGFWVSAALTAGLAQVTDIPLPGVVALAMSSGVGLIGDR